MNANETYYEPLVYIVPEEDDGILLKTVLRNRMHISRRLLTRLKLSAQGILLNGIRKHIDSKVQTGDRVEVRMQEEVSEDILPEEMPLAILYEDEHLLILNKPAGVIVHPTHGHYTGTLANGVVYHWWKQGVNVRFRPVHRLDQETSGVLAIAKNPYVHQHISEQMQNDLVLKEYIAIVHGKMLQEMGTVDAPIDRDKEHPRIRIVTSEGYPSVTHYWVEEAYEAGSVVRLRLETGRTHQIRVHMRHLGHPLIADRMYGPGGELETGIIPGSQEEADSLRQEDMLNKDEAFPIKRQALHAALLAFSHPATGQPVSFIAPLPADMQDTIDCLKSRNI